MRSPEAGEFLAPLRASQEEIDFWSHQSDGLTAFLSRDFHGPYRLPWAFQEELHVGGLYLFVTLLPLMHGNGRYFILALSQNHVRLFQGTKFAVGEVDPRPQQRPDRDS